MNKLAFFLLLPFAAALAYWPAADSETWLIDNLTSIGGYKTTVWGHPKVINEGGKKAVELNGIDDALLVDNHPLAGAKTFTWEVIFKPYSKGGAEQRFFNMQQNDADFRYLFETRLIDGKWCLDSFANTTAVGEDASAGPESQTRQPMFAPSLRRLTTQNSEFRGGNGLVRAGLAGQ